MTKAEHDALGEVFGCEINAALSNRPIVHQGKRKVFCDLVAQGLLVEVEQTLGGRFPVKLSGFVLTEAGRYRYCAGCKDTEAQHGQ
jgi:hypothetical protein